MCGIFGVVERGRPGAVIETALAATHALAHRGPDDWGVMALLPASSGTLPASGPRIHLATHDCDDAVAFGHRRLSIIDLSEAGRQPMLDRDTGSWLTYNGEIYNFRELKEELRATGPFATATDSEVISRAWTHWGLRAFEKLSGMFAIALWDPRRQALILARDRVGKKPLFYRQSRSGLAFASELQTFRHLPDWRPDIDPVAVHDFLTLGYVPGERTIFRDVHKVPPGTVATWHDGTLRFERYWDVATQFQSAATEPSEPAAIDELSQLLSAAVERRLISDVPLGAFLSGGLDSSLVVGLMARHAGKVKTFSIGFREDSFNELAHARTVARHFDTDHHEFVVEARAAELLPQLVAAMDEPFADASALPTYMLARLAREHVTVVLTGDGGDESFAGYDSYRAERWLDHYRRVPAVFRRVFERAIVHGREDASRTALVRRSKRFVEKSRLPFERREWRMIFSEEDKTRSYHPDFAAAVGDADTLAMRERMFQSWREFDLVTQLQLWDLTVYLPDDLLVKTDRATMAHALEARSPLLDHQLIEWSARLPSHFKVRGATTKYLLKKSAERLLPASIVHRTKQGFGVPVSHWLRTDLREMAHDVLLSTTARSRNYFTTEAVKRLLHEHASGQADRGHRLWAMINLELWHRTAIDQPVSATPAHLRLAAG
jgi:asparagine synthase (glutamine-hydrolysing)